jgi:hypothetical protein
LEPRSSQSNNHRPIEPAPPDPTDSPLAADRLEDTRRQGMRSPTAMRPSALSAQSKAANESAAQTDCTRSQRGGTDRPHPEMGSIQLDWHVEPERLAFPLVRGQFVGLAGLEPAASSLSEIDGQAPCYPAFPQVALIHEWHRDGVNRPAVTWPEYAVNRSHSTLASSRARRALCAA